MKMITAIVNGKDATDVGHALTQNGFMFTKTITTGGFLKASNATLLIGTDDDKVSEVLDIIRKHCAVRKEVVPVIGDVNYSTFNSCTVEVPVGGATVFVTDVVRVEKM